MEVKTITSDGFFRVFTACPLDPKTFILDVRSQKDFAKHHVMQAYNIRLAANGKALLDYSKNTYDVSWGQDRWWDKAVVVYGDANLKRDHPVVAFLAIDKHAKSLAIYKEGFEGFAEAYPFLCTASVKNNAVKRYPGEIVPKVLYLGDWGHAEQTERLDELNVKRVITIHNNPDNLKLSARFKHLRFQLADVDTQDITQFFSASYSFIEEGRAANEAVLVHCGAGVSRSPALCIAYLMRRFTWPAKRAREHCQQRRSLVSPNQGFWRSLCAFEEQLGITDRSDPADTVDFHGADAPAIITEGAAGEKVAVRFVPLGKKGVEGAAAAANGSREPTGDGKRDSDRGRESAKAGTSGRPEREGLREDGAAGGEASRRRSRSHDRHADRDGHSRDHGDGRDRDRRRDADRDRGRDRVKDWDKDRDRHRDRHRERGRYREVERDRATDRDRARERSREHHIDSGKRSRDRSHEERTNGKRHRSEEDSKESEVPSAEKPPGVILEVSKEGKAMGTVELGLHSIADKVVFGRAPTCDIVLEHLSISRQHATLSTDTAGNLFLTDLGSAHGTNVDGVWIRANEPRQLNKGIKFKLAASSREYKVLQVPKDIKPALAALKA